MIAQIALTFGIIVAQYIKNFAYATELSNDLCKTNDWSVMWGDWTYNSDDCSILANSTSGALWFPNSKYIDDSFILQTILSVEEGTGNGGLAFQTKDYSFSGGHYNFYIGPANDQIFLAEVNSTYHWKQIRYSLGSSFPDIGSIEYNQYYSLKIIANKTRHNFYINNTLLWENVELTSNALKLGTVGLGNYRTSTKFKSLNYVSTNTTLTSQTNNYIAIYDGFRSYSFYEAKDYCMRHFGSSLASIHSENDSILVENVRIDSSVSSWIGLNDENIENNWTWTDGTSYDYVINWASGEPNNLGGYQNCVQLYPQGDFDDTWCTYSLTQFICNAPQTWRPIFKINNNVSDYGKESNVYQYWTNGSSTNLNYTQDIEYISNNFSNDCSGNNSNNNICSNYRSLIIDDWDVLYKNESFSHIKISLYKSDYEKQYFVFEATEDIESWISQKYLIDSSYFDAIITGDNEGENGTVNGNAGNGTVNGNAGNETGNGNAGNAGNGNPGNGNGGNAIDWSIHETNSTGKSRYWNIFKSFDQCEDAVGWMIVSENDECQEWSPVGEDYTSPQIRYSINTTGYGSQHKGSMMSSTQNEIADSMVVYINTPINTTVYDNSITTTTSSPLIIASSTTTIGLSYSTTDSINISTSNFNNISTTINSTVDYNVSGFANSTASDYVNSTNYDNLNSTGNGTIYSTGNNDIYVNSTAHSDLSSTTTSGVPLNSTVNDAFVVQTENDIIVNWEFLGGNLVLILFGLSFLMFVFGIFYHKYKSKTYGCDEPNHFVVFKFTFNIADFWSDLLFCVIMYYEYKAADDIDDEETVWFLFLFSLLFVALPFIVECIIAVYWINRWKNWKDNNPIRLWEYLEKYEIFLYFLTVTGGFYNGIDLVKSKLFYKPYFNLPLKSNEYIRIRRYRLYNIVICENVPQLIIQMVYIVYNINIGKRVNLVAFISVVITILSLTYLLLIEISHYVNQRNGKTNPSFAHECQVTGYIHLNSKDLLEYHCFCQNKIQLSLNDLLSMHINGVSKTSSMSYAMEVFYIRDRIRILKECDIYFDIKFGSKDEQVVSQMTDQVVSIFQSINDNNTTISYIDDKNYLQQLKKSLTKRLLLSSIDSIQILNLNVNQVSSQQTHKHKKTVRINSISSSKDLPFDIGSLDIANTNFDEMVSQLNVEEETAHKDTVQIEDKLEHDQPTGTQILFNQDGEDAETDGSNCSDMYAPVETEGQAVTGKDITDDGKDGKDDKDDKDGKDDKDDVVVDIAV